MQAGDLLGGKGAVPDGEVIHRADICGAEDEAERGGVPAEGEVMAVDDADRFSVDMQAGARERGVEGSVGGLDFLLHFPLPCPHHLHLQVVLSGMELLLFLTDSFLQEHYLKYAYHFFLQEQRFLE